jgi:hypothetical protein
MLGNGSRDRFVSRVRINKKPKLPFFGPLSLGPSLETERLFGAYSRRSGSFGPLKIMLLADAFSTRGDKKYFQA